METNLKDQLIAADLLPILDFAAKSLETRMEFQSAKLAAKKAELEVVAGIVAKLVKNEKADHPST